MKTEDLIAALAADTAPGRRSLSGGAVAMTAAAALVSLAAFLAALGPRPDLAEALATWRFDAKLAIVGLAAALAFAECLRLMRPTARPSARTVLLVLAPVAAAVIAELLLSPSETWLNRQLGGNALICLTAIPALALAPLFALLCALRRGAPASPSGAGAMAGLASAAIAAALYATHCTDDSPLFVATWYTLATLIVVAIGATSGRHLLRW